MIKVEYIISKIGLTQISIHKYKNSIYNLNHILLLYLTSFSIFVVSTETPAPRTGVIAQDVAKVLPDAVYTSGRGQNPFILKVAFLYFYCEVLMLLVKRTEY